MATPRSPRKIHTHYHKDGSLWAKGPIVAGKPSGYWEWFRKDGTKLRSGHFIKGAQTGEWTTYDRTGKVYKVTTLTAKPVARRTAASAKRLA